MHKSAVSFFLAVLIVALPAGTLHARNADKSGTQAAAPARVSPQAVKTSGSVTVDGERIDYDAVAGTLILHEGGDQTAAPTVSMFYTAYFKQDAKAGQRPVMFIYNGGPGSATMWLHMGAFGPRRVITADHTHTPAAPYEVVNNAYSLLDAADLVFIDAPGAGFSRLLAVADDPTERAALMKKHEKEIYSLDGDARAFAQFIRQFLSRYKRWNSPKYLFGESYGTPRSAVLADILQSRDKIDLNGVVMLSQILAYDFSIDGVERHPGVDQAYFLALPSFAAVAWYHHKLPSRPAKLEPFLKKVEAFALGPYASALVQGAKLDPATKQAVAEKLHQFTGLPVAYILKANLRINGGMFRHELLSDAGEVTGRLGSQFKGPAMDPMGKSARYDPQGAAISSAYVSAFNKYVRGTLGFGESRHYRLHADIDRWRIDRVSRRHNRHGDTLNVIGDLAHAMTMNPNLKVQVHGGYFDTGTPYFAAEYEMAHLPIPAALQENISYHWYQSGHMIYSHEEALKKLHENVARFIEQTDNI
ncbi:MAG TPA: peptidase S10 [Oleiagrimonas sp.]|nr:peptidase S10 [Oleiagrimonas sp.]